MLKIILSLFFTSIFYFTIILLIREILFKRTVRIKLVVDEDFRRCLHWEKKARKIIEESSRIFNYQFGIRLKASSLEKAKTGYIFSRVDEFYRYLAREVKRGKITPKAIHDKRSHITTANNLKLAAGLTWVYDHFDFDSEDVIVFLSGKKYGENVGCVEKKLGRMVLISHPPNEEIKRGVCCCLHEFGHIFGAAHSSHRNSVMFRSITSSARFDKESREIILENKRIKFKQKPKPAWS